jgi:hypothetical protein
MWNKRHGERRKAASRVFGAPIKGAEMSKSSNDDRSNSLNPNNGAYRASLDNHYNQTSGSEDEDEACGPVRRPTPRRIAEPQSSEQERPVPCFNLPEPQPLSLMARAVTEAFKTGSM